MLTITRRNSEQTTAVMVPRKCTCAGLPSLSSSPFPHAALTRLQNTGLHMGLFLPRLRRPRLLRQRLLSPRLRPPFHFPGQRNDLPRHPVKPHQMGNPRPLGKITINPHRQQSTRPHSKARIWSALRRSSGRPTMSACKHPVSSGPITIHPASLNFICFRKFPPLISPSWGTKSCLPNYQKARGRHA